MRQQDRLDNDSNGCRMKDKTGRWSHWSDPIEFEAGAPLVDDIRSDLRITELMTHPAPARPDRGELDVDRDAFEFIELQNIGHKILDLDATSLSQGVHFDFGSGRITQLAPGAFVLVVRDEDAFLSRYGASLTDRIAGEYRGHFNNGGEAVRLEDSIDGLIATFTYGDNHVWPVSADGAGHSLVPLDRALAGEPQGTLNNPCNWRASSYRDGSPGAADPDLPTTVVLNEIAPHTDYSNPTHPEYTSNDWIELYNAGSAAVNLAGWTLSDDRDILAKWSLPAMVLPSHHYVVFNEVDDFHHPITWGFGLDKGGEQVFLSYLPGTADDRVVDAIKFKGVENGTTLSRRPDGGAYWFRTAPTSGKSNIAALTDVLITELMPQPLTGQDEYIELTNPANQTISFETEAGPWRIDGAVGYTFPSGFSLAEHQRLVLVGFDPINQPTRLAQFIDAYGDNGLVPGDTILGPWSGMLANEGERVTLEQLQLPDVPEDDVSWVVVDEVIYAPTTPWPVATDGLSLIRTSTSVQNASNDPANWDLALPTPGL